MTRRRWTLFLLALWALCIAASVAVPWVTAPKGDGLTRGLNIVMTFLGWQVAAGVVAVAVWAVGRRGTRPGLRRLSKLPLLIFTALVLAIAALLVGAQLDRPERPGSTPPAIPTRPVPAPTPTPTPETVD